MAFRLSVELHRRSLLCQCHKRLIPGFRRIYPQVQILPADLRPDVHLPTYLAQRIVPRWDDYRVIHFDLQHVSYWRNLKAMVIQLGLA